MRKPQNRRRALVAALAACIAIVIAAIAGCADGDVSTGPESPPATQAIDKVPDLTEVTSRGESNLYSAGNPYTDVTVKRLLESNDVSRAVARFQDMGMRVAPEDCVVIEGINKEGTVTAAFITLAPRAPDAVESGVLLCVEGGGERVLVPATFATEPVRTGDYTWIADGVWMNGTPFLGPDASPEDTERWSSNEWGRLFDCLLSSAPGPVLSCSVSCLIAGPGYTECLVVCASTQALTAVVRCVTAILISGDKDGGNTPCEK